MKKYITLVALGASLTAGAQQIQGDFEQWKDCVVYRGKDVATKKVGNDPQGWNGSNISQKGAVLGLSDKDDATLVTKVSGNVEGFAVQLQNKFVGALTIGAVAPAYVTLGTPWAYAKVNGTKIESSDGGTFGGLDFTYLPDALQFDYTLKRKENSTQPATISAYLWKGSYTATQKVGYNGKEEQMTDRDRFVLGTQTSTASEDSKLIATLQASINKDNSEWNTKTVPFEYKENGVSPEKINVIFCAGDYYGDQSLLERDNIFIVDNVKLIYYHALSTLSYEGATLNFNKEQIEYDLSEVEYEDKKLSYTKLGQGASVSTSYNEKTAILTITVKGNDYNEDTNSEAKTVYTVQFKKPAQTAVKGVKIGGEKYEDFDAETKEYTLPYAYNRGIYFETETEEGAEVSVVYNDEDETVTIQEGENSFVFKFTPAVEGQYSGTYPGALSVVLSNKKGDTPAPLDNSKIEVTTNQNGTINLAISNFSFAGLPVGNIFVSNVPVSDGNVEATKTITLTANNDSDLGPKLGALPVKVEASLNDSESKVIEADIDILTAETDLSMLFTNIHVDFFPIEVEGELSATSFAGPQSREAIIVKGILSKEAAALLQLNSDVNKRPMTYVDLSEATVEDDVTFEDVMKGAPENNNTLVFVPAESQIQGNNVVKEVTADKICLNASAPFVTSKAFTAKKVELAYQFGTGEKSLQGFVMPFSTATSGIDGTVYNFDGVNGGSLNLVSVDQLEANKPYFLYGTSEANPFSELTDVQIKPVTEEKEEMTVTKGDYTFTAYLAPYQGENETAKMLAYDSESQTFKLSDLLVNANCFEAVLTSTNNAEISLSLDGKVTSISETVTTPNALVSVYSLDGRLLRRAVNPSCALKGLAKGIYVVNGKKVTK